MSLFCLFFTPTLSSQEELSPKDCLWEEVAYNIYESFDFEKATKLLEEIKKMLPGEEGLEEKIECILYQSYCCLELKNWEGMRKYLEECQHFSKGLPISVQQSTFFSDYHYILGVYLFQQGTYELACAHYKETLRLIEGREDEFSFRIEDVYHNLAIVYQRMGDFQQAIPYLQFSASELEDQIEIAIRQNNLALCQMELGNFELAKEKLIESHAVIKREREHYLYVEAINENLLVSGKLYNRINQPKEALSCLNKVELEKINPAQKIEALFEKGIALLRLGEVEQAAEFHQEALFGGASEIFTQHPNLALCLKELGDIYSESGEMDKAMDFFDKSLAVLIVDSVSATEGRVLQSIQAKPLYFNSLLAKANALKQMGEQDAYLAVLLQADGMLEELILQDLESSQSKYFWIDRAKEIYETIIEAMIQLDQKESAWKFIQKGKGILLTQSINQLQVARDNPDLDRLVRQKRDVQLDIDYLETQSSIAKETTKSQVMLEKIIQLNKEQGSIDQIILDSFPGFHKWGEQYEFLTIETARKRLTSKSDLLLDMFVGAKDVYLFGLTQQELFLERIPYPTALKADLLAFKNLISQLSFESDNYATYCSLGYRLYDEIFRKGIERPMVAVNKILFIPDEEFNYLPLAALLTNPVAITGQTVRYDNLPYLVRGVDVSYEYATKLLDLNPLKPALREKENTLMAYAPSFTGKESVTRGGDALLYNMEEAQTIHDILGGKINLGEQATKSNFLEDIRQYRVAHLATHAYCNDSLPFNSHIEFFEDSLRLFEIVNVSHQLDLIVLSACETGRGKLSRGEGISSLARGFINSGCPSIVTTMWQVNDRQTSKLMADFYRFLADGAAKDKALGQAQRDYLSGSLSASLAHPFYWAPFIQIGNSDPIVSSGWPPWAIPLLAAGALLLLFVGYRKRKAA